MTYSVDVDKDIRQMYTWRDMRRKGWQWNTYDCRLKPWAEFGLIYFTATITGAKFGLDDSDVRRAVDKFCREVLKAEDVKISKDLSKELMAYFRLKDRGDVSFHLLKELSKRIGVDDSVANNLAKEFEGYFAISPNRGRHSFTKSEAEKFSIASKHTEVLEFLRYFDSSVAIDSSSAIGTFLKKKEQFSLVDAHPVFNFLQVSWRTLQLNTGKPEWYFKTVADFRRTFDEDFGVIYWTDKTIEKAIESGFGITEAIAKGYYKLQENKLRILDRMASTILFNRYFDENLDVEEAISKTTTKPFIDKLRILDELFLGGGVTVSDLRVLEHALTDADFDELFIKSAPKDFGEFKPFLAGDYEYQEALLKVIMTTQNSSRPYIEQLRVEVDLPDIFDKGIESIPASRTTINFKKQFYTIPQVSVVVNAGTTAFVPMVKVESITLTGFDVELRNPENNTVVGGTVNWKAQGY
ncbi:hypothetical protein VCR15J2_390141 [Vibrio coralliirubri]|uniref:H-type lectin domain-containing protein n=1 Tax=Vibrio coralliirubri TaxID=1516159 RepID=UPI000631D3F9|nr:H-type lectin domain-containing protein [Vibrio coralliirubri]CDT54257.1 hypothetical protein VCR15J2_390141 [Vibrio coralliirubri]